MSLEHEVRKQLEREAAERELTNSSLPIDQLDAAFAMSNFKKLSNKLHKKGHSRDSANRIAAAIGRKKYGAEGMARKSAAARRGK